MNNALKDFLKVPDTQIAHNSAMNSAIRGYQSTLANRKNLLTEQLFDSNDKNEFLNILGGIYGEEPVPPQGESLLLSMGKSTDIIQNNEMHATDFNDKTEVLPSDESILVSKKNPSGFNSIPRSINSSKQSESKLGFNSDLLKILEDQTTDDNANKSVQENSGSLKKNPLLTKDPIFKQDQTLIQDQILTKDKSFAKNQTTSRDGIAIKSKEQSQNSSKIFGQKDHLQSADETIPSSEEQIFFKKNFFLANTGKSQALKNYNVGQEHSNLNPILKSGGKINGVNNNNIELFNNNVIANGNKNLDLNVLNKNSGVYKGLDKNSSLANLKNNSFFGHVSSSLDSGTKTGAYNGELGKNISSIDLSLSSLNSANENGITAALNDQALNDRNSNFIETKSGNQVLDFSNIRTTNTNELIGRIADYINSNSSLVKSGEGLDLLVRHNELGDFNINVNHSNLKGQSESVAIEIKAFSESGHKFFVENEKLLLRTLDNAGVRVSDLKMNFSSNNSLSNSFGNSLGFASDGGNDSSNGKSFSQSHEQNFSRSNYQSSQTGSDMLNHGQKKRMELWEEYKERYGT